jgi:hypothetical protein
MYQNDLKTPRKKQFKAKKKIKKNSIILKVLLKHKNKHLFELFLRQHIKQSLKLSPYNLRGRLKRHLKKMNFFC